MDSYDPPPPSTPLKNSTNNLAASYGALSRSVQRKMVQESQRRDYGVLVVRSVYLNGLRDEADPYLVIESGDWKYVTERRDADPQPRWNCWFSFPFEGLESEIKIHLMDHQFWTEETQCTLRIKTDELMRETRPEADSIRCGKLKVRDREISYFVDFKFQEWPVCLPIKDLSSNKAERQRELEKPEMFMRAVHFAISLQIQKWKPIICDSIPIPSVPKGQRIETVWSLDKYFFCLEEDLDVPIPPEAGILIKLINTLPFDDEVITFISKQEAIDYVHRVFGALIIDPTEGTWTDLTGDEAMTRYFFYNNGAVFMEQKPEGGFKCDLDWCLQFDCRKKYFPYGGVTHFDAAGKCTHIVYKGRTYLPDGSKEWEFMKLVSRSSAFVCAAGIHLIQGHLTWSNYPNYAMRKDLSPEHPIRRLLHVHFWRSAMVCSKSLQSLIPENGLLHRGTEFSIDGLHDFYKNAIDQFKFQTFEEDLKERNMWDVSPDIYPTAHDGKLFWNMLNDYVTAFINLHYKNDNACHSDPELVAFWDTCSTLMTPKPRKFKYTGKTPKSFPKLTLENLKLVLTEFIFRVTAWHQNIGNALAPINDPGCISLRLIEGEYISCVQSLYVQGLVTMLTSMRMPTMSSTGAWTHMFRGTAEEAVYNDFRDAMNNLSSTIIELNKHRDYKIVDYDPRFTCVSVSS